eukprot:8378071-Prorocentrum_lima.AAC.1
MEAVLECMELLALPVNIAPAKTACILKLVGTGCAPLSSALPIAEFSGRRLPYLQQGPFSVPIVHSY